MTALDFLFVMGQALMLSSLVYFLGLAIWWRFNQPADLEAAERFSELKIREETRATPPAIEADESHSHQEIAHA
jgi:hypothetical protein